MNSLATKFKPQKRKKRSQNSELTSPNLNLKRMLDILALRRKKMKRKMAILALRRKTKKNLKKTQNRRNFSTMRSTMLKKYQTRSRS